MLLPWHFRLRLRFTVTISVSCQPSATDSHKDDILFSAPLGYNFTMEYNTKRALLPSFSTVTSSISTLAHLQLYRAVNLFPALYRYYLQTPATDSHKDAPLQALAHLLLRHFDSAFLLLPRLPPPLPPPSFHRKSQPPLPPDHEHLTLLTTTSGEATVLLIAPAFLNSLLHKVQHQGTAGRVRQCTSLINWSCTLVGTSRHAATPSGASLYILWDRICTSINASYRIAAAPVSLQRSSPSSFLRHILYFKTHSCRTRSSCRTTTAPQRSQTSAAASSFSFFSHKDVTSFTAFVVRICYPRNASAVPLSTFLPVAKTVVSVRHSSARVSANHWSPV